GLPRVDASWVSGQDYLDVKNSSTAGAGRPSIRTPPRYVSGVRGAVPDGRWIDGGGRRDDGTADEAARSRGGEAPRRSAVLWLGALEHLEVPGLGEYDVGGALGVDGDGEGVGSVVAGGEGAVAGPVRGPGGLRGAHSLAVHPLQRDAAGVPGPGDDDAVPGTGHHDPGHQGQGAVVLGGGGDLRGRTCRCFVLG